MICHHICKHFLKFNHVCYYNNDDDGYMEYAFLKSLPYVHEPNSILWMCMCYPLLTHSLKVMHNQEQILVLFSLNALNYSVKHSKMIFSLSLWIVLIFPLLRWKNISQQEGVLFCFSKSPRFLVAFILTSWRMVVTPFIMWFALKTL